MKENIFKYDYYRMTGKKYKKGISKFIQLSLFHNLKYVYWYRRYQKTHGIIARMIIWKLSRKFGLEISTKAQIGKGLYLGHSYNITVGDDVVSGALRLCAAFFHGGAWGGSRCAGPGYPGRLLPAG